MSSTGIIIIPGDVEELAWVAKISFSKREMISQSGAVLELVLIANIRAITRRRSCSWNDKRLRFTYSTLSSDAIKRAAGRLHTYTAGRRGLAVACLAAVSEVLGSNRAVGSYVYCKNHCDLQHWARAVCTLPAVPRLTQPSTLRGTVNEYQLWVE